MSNRISIQDLTRQGLIRGTSCFTTRDGNTGYKVEDVQASALVRIADALERQGQQLATVCIDPYRADDFRDLVEEFDGAPWPLAIERWWFTNVSSLSVTVSFDYAGVLFALGARWNWESEREQARQQEGGQPSC